MNEVGDYLNFIFGGVGIFKGIGSFIADGGHAESTDAENIVDETALRKADIFDGDELDDVGGLSEKRGAGVMNQTFISDVEQVIIVDASTDDAKNTEDAKENNNRKHQERTGVGGGAKNGVGDTERAGSSKNSEGEQEHRAENRGAPDKKNADFGTVNGELDVFVVFKFEPGKVLFATSVAEGGEFWFHIVVIITFYLLL